MKQAKYFVVILTVLFFQTACKKEGGKKPECRIINVIQSSPLDTLFISYSDDGTIKNTVIDTITTIYTYSGNTTIVRRFGTSGLLGKTTITNNEAGLAINVRAELNAAGTVWTNNVYEYNGDEVTISTSTDSNGGSPIVSFYTWQDHNMVKITRGTTVYPYEYFTDKLSAKGDYFSLSQLLQGYKVFKTKNLLKSGDGFSFTYEPGSDGNISSFTINNALTLKSFFECSN
jgi:hypothetical protein